MLKPVNFTRGIIRFKVSGSHIERLLNICAEHHVGFWQLERIDETTIHVSIRLPDKEQFEKLAAQAAFDVMQLQTIGTPFIWQRVKKRLGLIIGLGVFAIMIFVMSQFVWDIEIIGNERIPVEVILHNLQEIGIGVGTPVRRIDSPEVRDLMMLRIDDLSWLTINVRGSRATVEVRERVLGEPIIDMESPAHIVARRPGVIVAMSVLNGQQVALPDMTVNTGDILINGQWMTEHGDHIIVHAQGEVFARTWYEIEGMIPLTMTGKEYTGNSRTVTGLQIGRNLLIPHIGRRANFEFYDKQRTETSLTLPPGVRVPVTMIRETYSEFRPYTYTMSRAVAEAALERRLREELVQQSRDAEIISIDFEFIMQDGVLFGRLVAECRERIDMSVPFIPNPETAPTPTPEW